MLDNYRDLIDELLGTPKALREALGGRGAGEVAPEVVALVGELLARDRAVLLRLQTIQREPNALLRALDGGTAEAPAEASDPAALLDAFDTARGDLVSLLMNLTLKDWERTATHEVDGEITLADEVERHVEFDEDHVARIERAAGGA